ncbi:MAG: cytochrome c3 family protein [Archaeoglobaceae archaeon]
MNKVLTVILVVTVILVSPAAASQESCGLCHDLSEMDFNSSIHKRISGIVTGFEQTTGKDFNMDTPDQCYQCHTEDCSTCHPVHKETISMMECNQCHGSRVGANFMGKLNELEEDAPHPDVHYEKGFECLDCHDVDKLHGDGNYYTFAEQAVEITCEDCHVEGKEVEGKQATYDPGTDAHRLHQDVDCSACHAGYYQTCKNCHLDTGEIDSSTLEDFQVMKYADKYYPAYIQSVSLDDMKSKGAGAFSPHTITADARECEECHENEEEVFMTNYDGRVFGPPGTELAEPPSRIAADLSYFGVDYEVDITLLGSLIIGAVVLGLAVHFIKRRISLGRWIG